VAAFASVAQLRLLDVPGVRSADGSVHCLERLDAALLANRCWALPAGPVFDFTASVWQCIATFRISGIDPAEALDPTGHAFATGLSFVAESELALGAKMTPITAVPEPGTFVPDAAQACAALRTRIGNRAEDLLFQD